MPNIFSGFLAIRGAVFPGIESILFPELGNWGLGTCWERLSGWVIGAGAEDEQGSGRHRAVIFQVMLRLEFWGLFLFFFPCSSVCKNTSGSIVFINKVVDHGDQFFFSTIDQTVYRSIATRILQAPERFSQHYQKYSSPLIG